jgi:hypothetical protein
MSSTKAYAESGFHSATVPERPDLLAGDRLTAVIGVRNVGLHLGRPVAGNQRIADHRLIVRGDHRLQVRRDVGALAGAGEGSGENANSR